LIVLDGDLVDDALHSGSIESAFKINRLFLI
jgi:hypothetical protein